MKLDATGAVLFTNSFSGGSAGTSITIDAQGKVIVGGHFDGTVNLGGGWAHSSAFPFGNAPESRPKMISAGNLGHIVDDRVVRLIRGEWPWAIEWEI